MSSVNKISFFEAIWLILIITINRAGLYLPQKILSSCGSSAILNVIYIGLIAVVLTIIIAKLFSKFSGADIIDVSQFLGGKYFKNIVGIVLISYLIFISAILIRDFSEIIHIVYYQEIPVMYLLAFFIIVAIIANFLGEHTIIKTNALITIFMVISLLITFMLIVPNIVVQRALPILGYGAYETFFSGLANVFSFNGLLSLYFIPPMLKDKSPKNLKKIAIVSIIVASIFLLLAVGSLLLSFSFSTILETISPIYLLISNNELGEYFQHPESLFVLAWILAFMTYTNISCMFTLRILKKITNVKNSKPFIIPICILIFLIAIIPDSITQVREVGKFGCKYFCGPMIFIFLPLILFFANLKYKRFHKKEFYVEEQT